MSWQAKGACALFMREYLSDPGALIRAPMTIRLSITDLAVLQNRRALKRLRSNDCGMDDVTILIIELMQD